MCVVKNMIYLDYSATTPVDESVLDSYMKSCKDFIGNPNSLHSLGVKSKKIIDDATKQIADLLGVKESEIIYTSGSSESNNTAIKGIGSKYSNRGKHIITTNFEHSSIYGPISYLQKQGFDVDFVKTDSYGRVILSELKSLIREDTLMVSITAVNSEIGIIEPIEEIGKFIKENYPKCFFHVDMTQLVTKKKIDFKYIDLASMSAHKFYGMKGIGILYKKENISIEPLIHGGKSTTVYRSGTPALPLIISTSKAMRLAMEGMNSKYKYVANLNEKLRNELSTYDKVRINSNEYSLPHILNISILGVKPETMLHALEEYDIFISTQTACSDEGSISKAVMSLTNDEERASSSIRISISYKTTEEEINEFLKYFKVCYNSLTAVK